MAFRDFTFPRVLQDLDLTSNEADLYSQIPALQLRAELVAEIMEGATLALAVNTEKAKSEFIIAPVLLELRRLLGRTFGLFSGVELDVDAGRGLNGVCDFLITRTAKQFVLTTPLVAIVEAKNDNLRSGLGQCISAMFAAQLLNEQTANPVPAVHGVVTTGSAWKFLRLQGNVVTVDLLEYYIDNLGKIMGILKEIIEKG
jgi:hypothetical protein